MKASLATAVCRFGYSLLPQTPVLNPVSIGMEFRGGVIGEWSGYEGGALGNGISAFYKMPSFTPFNHVRLVKR